jgi:pilus assembly protein Flp/PilA
MDRLAKALKLAARWLKVRGKRGVSAIEYGLLAALIALTIIASVSALGADLKGMFNSISTGFCPMGPDGRRSC